MKEFKNNCIHLKLGMATDYLNMFAHSLAAEPAWCPFIVKLTTGPRKILRFFGGERGE